MALARQHVKAIPISWKRKIPKVSRINYHHDAKYTLNIFLFAWIILKQKIVFFQGQQIVLIELVLCS